ncbi:MAG TPA: oligopeptidase B, partial [Flavobacteriales bacterium]|nr:oligopeptidase B [Flavobacteriales bacterium]
MEPTPPVAAQQPHVLNEHGHRRDDPYFWMRLSEAQREAAAPDPHTQQVIDHLNAENAYTDRMLAPVKELRTTLFQEMKGRVKETDMSVPYRENGYWYSSRFEEGKEYAIHMREPVGADKDVMPTTFTDIVDENVLAKGHSFFDLGDLEISPDNGLMAYSVDTVGRRQYTVYFRDLRTGEDLPDVITHTSGGGAFADERTFFYARKDRTLRSYKVFRHILGTDQKQDVEVFHEKDTAYSCEVYRSRSDQFVIINSESTLSSDNLLLPVSDPLGAFKAFIPREEEHEYSILHVKAHAGTPGGFYILTNWNAKNFRMMQCPEGDTAKSAWTEVVAHRDDVLLEDLDVFSDHWVLTERSNGLVDLRVHRLSNAEEHRIAFKDP